jgi:hypothetical protein
MLAITAASAANSIVQQSKAAAAQDEFNQKQREASIKAMNDNMSQIELAKQQATEQAGQKTFENDIAARKAMATAKVSAGEAVWPVCRLMPSWQNSTAPALATTSRYRPTWTTPSTT